MIVVLSVMDGFESELKKRMMSSDLHILIKPTPKISGFQGGFVKETDAAPTKVLTEHPELKKKIDQFWPVVSTEVILKSGRKVMGVVLKGITPERLERIKQESVEQVLGAAPKETNRIFVGQELAYELGLAPGDLVTLVSPTEVEGPLGNIPRLRRYSVQGIYHAGMPEQELHTVYASAETIRAFLRRSGIVSEWEIAVKDFDQAPEIADQIRKLLPDYSVQDWMQLNSHLFASLLLERFAMFIILAFIIVVASFNIVTTLTLMVLEKKKEISIMKAMGAGHNQVAAIFLAEGILIGSIGIGGGALLGFVLCTMLKRYEFITLPDIYYDRTLPVTFDPMYYGLVCLCAVVIVFAACLYPSRRAARLNPLEGIRFG